MENKRETKFEKVINANGGLDKSIERINSLLKENSLDKVAKELDIPKSTLSAGLKNIGFTYSSASREYVKRQSDRIELSMEDYKFLSMGDFSKSITFRADRELASDFQKMCKEMFPNVPESKMYSLAMKYFLENMDKK